MESDPHPLIEGLLIGAYATGATHGWIYIRDEYPLAIERMRTAIEQARAKGILGDDALGTRRQLRRRGRARRRLLRLRRRDGPHRVGRTTARHAEDQAAVPGAERRPRHSPTNVNNVETYADVTTLLSVDAETYSNVGTEANRGTKMFTLSGDVAQHGLPRGAVRHEGPRPARHAAGGMRERPRR